MPMIDLVCNYCEKRFQRPNWRYNPNAKTYCCKECSNIGNSNSTIVECDKCGKEILRSNWYLISHSKHFCSEECQHTNRRTSIEIECPQCGSKFYRKPSRIAKHKNNFCSRSCLSIYTNAHKTTGYRRSKIELMIEEILPHKFKNLDFEFNSRADIKRELDIYVPSLRLAFEINGIFHYQPIYGEEMLLKIKSRDERKASRCLEANIELHSIDISHIKKLKENEINDVIEKISSVIQRALD